MIIIKEVCLTKEILEEIRALDVCFYPNIGPIDWYLARYKPWHRFLVAMDKESIIGYLASVPVRKELYDAVLNGVLVDDLGINPDMYLKDSPYYYAGSILIKENYRGLNISRRLLDAYIEKYRDRKTCLIAVSKSGYRLAEHYFSLVKNLSENVSVFASKD